MNDKVSLSYFSLSHTHTLSLSPSLSHSYLSLSFSLSRTNMCVVQTLSMWEKAKALSLTLSLSVSLSLYFPLSLSVSFTLSFSLSLNFFPSHTHKHVCGVQALRMWDKEMRCREKAPLHIVTQYASHIVGDTSLIFSLHLSFSDRHCGRCTKSMCHNDTMSASPTLCIALCPIVSHNDIVHRPQCATDIVGDAQSHCGTSHIVAHCARCTMSLCDTMTFVRDAFMSHIVGQCAKGLSPYISHFLPISLIFSLSVCLALFLSLART